MALAVDEIEASDADLIGRARGGDGQAFGQLVERHYDFVYRVAWRWCGRKTDAEDVAQEVCVRLGSAIKTYRGAGAFTTWLYTLTLNAARDFSRKTARETAKTEAFGVHALIDGEAQPEPEDQAEALWAAVRQLPDKQRDAVLLVYGEGLSHAAASDVMAISEATVSWHIHEAKKRLKVLMRSAGKV
ncbi:sigma-70 family RNA polymerase sigma factor [Mesorhizobium sp. LHD-90]|uniref:RNA polymerase sigma factor n=1 Tax=Mesorhizobium sp. LHD-90 TaxID=3071414 RepID=UPI0027E191D9|nr:sigma-70 family RNA polymerase sigma factor [Mesorhizobium sp. LHD-90]MDQ6433033.1 sigma-70 family RNA polymerase sigma factor [Mesorhizobium sp. LHD-90]